MPTLTIRQQFAVAAALAVLMAATRGQHAAALGFLPPASWAVFFLAGAYLRPAWTFAAFMGLAAAIDFAAVTWGGVDSFCISPAYVFLVPAYGALWAAGRWYRRRHRAAWGTLGALAGAVVVGAFACELISSGSFYFLSGRFAAPQLAEFGARLLRYLPGDLASVVFYVAIAALVHVAVALARRPAHPRGAAGA